MSLGLSAGTATAIGIGLGTAALGTGGSILASSLAGGGAGKINSKQIKKDLAEYMAQINAAIGAGRGNVNSGVAAMDGQIEDAANNLSNASDQLTKEFWNKLGIENKSLINTASALVNSYDGDVTKALQTLQTNIGKPWLHLRRMS